MSGCSTPENRKLVIWAEATSEGATGSKLVDTETGNSQIANYQSDGQALGFDNEGRLLVVDDTVGKSKFEIYDKAGKLELQAVVKPEP
jgi:hypothetical protein